MGCKWDVKQSFYIPKINLSMVSSPPSQDVGNRLDSHGFRSRPRTFWCLGIHGVKWQVWLEKQLKSPNDSRGYWWITQWLQRLLMNHHESSPLFCWGICLVSKEDKAVTLVTGDVRLRKGFHIATLHASPPSFMCLAKGHCLLRTIQAFR